MALILLLTACGSGENTTQKHGEGGGDSADAGFASVKHMRSNMNDEGSLEEVRSALRKVLNEKSVEEFIHTVIDYNRAVEYEGKGRIGYLFVEKLAFDQPYQE